MKKQLATLAILALATVAHAGGIGNTANNGGKGGEGGSATAGAVAGAAAGAAASTHTDVRNTNVNSAAQQQGQVQGQQQAAVAGSSSGGNTMSTNVTHTESQRPVSSALAPALAASNGTCMGSTSVGGQGVTIGLSVGTTWADESCNARYDAQALAALGQQRAGIARLCQSKDVAAAMEAAGTPCPGKAKTAAAAPAEASTVTASNEPTDPFIRRRLGLPAL